MKLQELTAAGLEQALNALLKLDSSASKQLSRLHGQVIAVVLQGLQLRWYFIADESGRLQVLSQYEGVADTTITGSPFSLIRATDSQQGSAQLFSGEMQITGNTELAHRFSSILGGLDIDWEDHLARFTGDIVAHQIGKATRNAQTQMASNGRTLERNISEYLTEETRLLPSRQETDNFLDQIDTLRDDVDRLAARVQLLQQHTGANA